MLRAFVGSNLSKFKASLALCLYGVLTSFSVVAADSKDEYQWSLPPGFPKPPIPPDNPMSTAKVQLGCRLFFDTRLSTNGVYACASCHRPELAFSDGRVTAVGTTGEPVRRNAMSLTNVAYNASYTWASRNIVTLEAQMERPLFGTHPLEMGLARNDKTVSEVLANAEDAREFHAAFPGEQAPISVANAIKAIAAYERTLISGRSAFDRYVFDDVRDALSANARRGMAIFYSERGGCGNCHSGLNFSGSIVHQQAKAAALFANTGLYNIDGSGAYPASDTGLLEESNAPSDMGKFRVPTLRNIALTAPYMHDGSIATLTAVVEHYSRGGKQSSLTPTVTNKLKDPKIKPLLLTSGERDDLVAFLESLTDTEFVALDRRECSRIHAPSNR
jgi:cytochrome c peroxidase